jgi:hypothetical protein
MMARGDLYRIPNDGQTRECGDGLSSELGCNIKIFDVFCEQRERGNYFCGVWWGRRSPWGNDWHGFGKFRYMRHLLYVIKVQAENFSSVLCVLMTLLALFGSQTLLLSPLL